MKTIALISGGKDSILSVMLAMRYGHMPVVVANICPACSSEEESEHVDELDSYSFQTVGYEAVEAIASCMDLPLRRAYIRAGQSKEQGLYYTKERDDEDEIETLYRLLHSVKEEFPDVEGVTTGAILSNYQRYRVEDVCDRLELHSFAFLWQRPAEEVLDMATALHLRAILVKTACIGLHPRIHIGLSLEDVRPALEKTERLYGTHGAGEGGEYETIVLDCPLFKVHCLEIDSIEQVIVDDNDYSPSGYARLKVMLREKTLEERAVDKELLQKLPTFMFPSDRMCHLPHVHPFLKRNTESFELERVSHPSVSVNNNTPFWSNGVYNVYDSEVLQTDDQLELCLAGVFEQIVRDMSERNREIFSLVVFSPSIEYYDVFCLVFARFFLSVQPPGCTFVELSSEVRVLRLEVLSAPRQFIQRATLRVRSISCWASVFTGPQSFSNLVIADGERCVIVSGCIGLVPVVQRLAVAENMPELLTVSLSRLAHAAGVEENALRAFVVQFAFAYANSVVGLGHFSEGDAAATHATFFLVDLRFASLLPLLWRWCAGDSVKLQPWGVGDSSGSTADAGIVLYRVLHVSRLLCGADVELILERRTPHLREGEQD